MCAVRRDAPLQVVRRVNIGINLKTDHLMTSSFDWVEGCDDHLFPVITLFGDRAQIRRRFGAGNQTSFTNLEKLLRRSPRYGDAHDWHKSRWPSRNRPDLDENPFAIGTHDSIFYQTALCC